MQGTTSVAATWAVVHVVALQQLSAAGRAMVPLIRSMAFERV
jgi:hypothetical protein